MKPFSLLAFAFILFAPLALSQPRVETRPTPFHRFLGVSRLDKKNAIDCNSPAEWAGKTFLLFNSYGQPYRGDGRNLFRVRTMSPTLLDGSADGRPLSELYIWLESTWLDERGVLYGWYHYEPDDVCKPNAHLPTAPKIGALRSFDRGLHWEHLGIVIQAPPDSLRCDTPSPWDAGGHGDFSVIPDPGREYFYFFFSSYVKDPAEQGVAAARMRYADRDQPVGKVFKWHDGGWTEPGLGGKLTPIWPAQIDWHRPDANLFWGPSIHWNTHLQSYVILMNRAVTTGMKGDGTWISFSTSLGDPRAWSQPVQVLTAEQARAATKGAQPGNAANYGWYPQVMGTAPGQTDKLAGKTARLFIAGVSNLEIVFLRPGEKP